MGLSRIPFSFAASVMLCLLFVLPSVSAAVTVTVNINPPTPSAHKPFTVSGQFVGYGPGVAWIMDLYDDGVCGGGGIIWRTQALTGNNGVYSYTWGGVPAGSYSVLVYDTFGDSSSCTPFTVTEKGGGHARRVRHFTVIEVPYSICVIVFGVEQPDGTILWLPGCAVPGTPISLCQDTTGVLGVDVLGRTRMFHRFIENGTSSKMVPA